MGRALLGMLLLGALAASAANPVPPDPARVEAKGLHNVYRITDKLLSGSSPEGDDGFRSLCDLGVKTIITVDGARPEIERAHKFGLRYVHLPIGYDGASRAQILRIAKAVRDLPGLVYLHCHHGMHRGPAAAAAVHLCLDPACGVETALAEMRRAGTDPHYKGLYATTRDLRRPTPPELDRVAGEFPETAPVPALAELMVHVDERWDHLKAIRAAGWYTPSQHPDLDPPHEALQLVEHYREAARLKEAQDRPEEFRRRLAEAEARAVRLETALRRPTDKAAAEQAFRSVGESCLQCHTRYRDVPRQR